MLGKMSIIKSLKLTGSWGKSGAVSVYYRRLGKMDCRARRPRILSKMIFDMIHNMSQAVG
jgi:hypothetical protein